MARPAYITVAAVGNSAPFAMPYRGNEIVAGLAVIVAGTGTYTVQFSFDSPDNHTPTNWFNHDVLASISASTASNLVIPATWVRLNCSAYTSGSGTLQMVFGNPT